MPFSQSRKDREQSAQECVADIFKSSGWKLSPAAKFAKLKDELIVEKSRQSYLLEIKSIGEGRPDRVIPLLSQAILMARAKADEQRNNKLHPMAVVLVESASPALSRQIQEFAEKFAPKVALGLISRNGLRFFQGQGLEALNRESDAPRGAARPPQHKHINLFSDLNQWMLKVLLAPEIPEHLLNAPRNKYENGAQLASAAGVSPMSASRFLKQLRQEGYLDESSRYLQLVRRHDLFRHWSAAANRPANEIAMKFRFPGDVAAHLKQLIAKYPGNARLGLFAAADALQLGHVSGVPPHLLINKLPGPEDKVWRALVPAAPSESPDLIVRKEAFPVSSSTGAVERDGVVVSDVFQVWLDVANHPARGSDQANLIYKKFLQPIEKGAH